LATVNLLILSPRRGKLLVMKLAVRAVVVLLLLIATYFVYAKRHAAALNNQGAALIAEGRPAEAIPFLEKARRLDPQNPRALKNLGAAYDGAGDEKKAIEAFAAAASRWAGPKNDEFFTRLEQLRDNDRLRLAVSARVARLKASGWQDDNISAEQTLSIAERNFMVGNFDNAILLAERALFKDSNNLDIMRLIEDIEAERARSADVSAANRAKFAAAAPAP
jgi:tetratricopeptide (TPR) repeat protein